MNANDFDEQARSLSAIEILHTRKINLAAAQDGWQCDWIGTMNGVHKGCRKPYTAGRNFTAIYDNPVDSIMEAESQILEALNYEQAYS